MRVKELIEKLKSMPETASVIIPAGLGKYAYVSKTSMGIYYPYANEYVIDDNDEDEVNSVLIF